MSTYEIILPRMGEGIIEATIIRWLKKEGEAVTVDEPILEIATDKVDSEIAASNSGFLTKILFQEGDVAAIGAVVAIISDSNSEEKTPEPVVEKQEVAKPAEIILPDPVHIEQKKITTDISARFFSPLVKNMARIENISIAELETIAGSGKDGRITKVDLDKLIAAKNNAPTNKIENGDRIENIKTEQPKSAPAVIYEGDRVEEMDRMRKLIADHMTMSIKTSVHVTSIIEVNMSKIVNWRNKIKDAFLKREGEKITFTPIIFNVVAKALKEFPGLNASVDGTKIIFKKNINIGMATVLPNGNLIVPVIKNADEKNLLGLTKTINDIAARARASKLQPDEIQGGTFSITNLGSFDTLLGTPIINQPQVAILAVGAIRKQPVVIESEFGDSLGIASMMYLSLSYDHRVVDGGMGGLFIKRIKELLENYDDNSLI